MAVNAEIPSWIQAADPASHMARGLQIGVQLGAQQAEQQRQQALLIQHAQQQNAQLSAEEAANEFKRQQMAMQAQQVAQDQELARQHLQLTAADAARKSKAIMDYQTALQGGMDPLQAILQFGPGMGGQASPEAAALRSQAGTKLPAPAFVPENADTGEPSHFVLHEPGGGTRLAFAPRQKATAAAPEFFPANPDTGEPARYVSGGRVQFVPKTAPEGQLSAAQREELRASRKVLADFMKDYGNPMMAKMAKKADPEGYDAAQAEAKAAADAILAIQPNDPQARRFAGGSAKGGGGGNYSSPADVKAAVKAGTLSKDEAAKVLVDQFGYEP